MPSDVTSKTLRLRSRSLVLRKLLLDGETTRSILANAVRLSPGTITNVFSDLIGEGLLHETGILPSEGGRPTTKVSLRPEGAFFAGANVGHRGVTVDIFDLALKRRASVFQEVLADHASPQELGAATTSALERATKEAGTASLYGVGLGMPGIVECTGDSSSVQQEITVSAQSLGWPTLSLESMVPIGDVPFFADNAARTLTNAERWFGAARGASNAVVTLFGRGVGLGVISGGQLFPRVPSSAGEWGHSKISIGGPLCNCGSRGCLEAYVGEVGIAERWRKAGGTPDGNEERAFTQLIKAADAADPTAVSVLDETVEIMGVGLSNLVNLYNPERIIIGGWVGLRLSPKNLATLTSVARANALIRPAEHLQIIPAALPGDAIALGAALLPVEHLIAVPRTEQSLPTDTAAPGAA